MSFYVLLYFPYHLFLIGWVILHVLKLKNKQTKELLTIECTTVAEIEGTNDIEGTKEIGDSAAAKEIEAFVGDDWGSVFAFVGEVPTFTTLKDIDARHWGVRG